MLRLKRNRRRQYLVLLADDDPSILDALTLALRSDGFRVLKAHDGPSALKLAHARHPDLLVLDWHMPGLDGLDVCRSLRAHANPQVHKMPILLATAKSGPENTATGFRAGATDYLTKPLVLSNFRARVHTWLLRTAH
jgi:DNA-binding response OmpR family regulator